MAGEFGADLVGLFGRAWPSQLALPTGRAVLGIAERAGRPISFWQFTRNGLIISAATIAVSALYLWLRYFALA
jgi:hypothetical protein